MVAQMSVGMGLLLSGQGMPATSTTMLGRCGDDTFAAYVCGVRGPWHWVAWGLVGAGVGFGRALRSFLTSVVALARLASVFSRLVSRIWSELSSLAGVLAAWGLFGRRD